MLKKIVLFLFLVLTFTTIGSADVIGPDGITRDYYGSKVFHTKHMRVDLQNPDVVIIKTTTPYPLDEVEYNISDVYFRVNEKDSIGIKMSGKDKGNILYNPEWKNTKDVFGSINEYCKDALTGEYIKVEATGGRVIGKATIIERKVSKTEWEITIIIAKRLLEGKNIVAEFATAKCGNSLVTEEFYVAKTYRPTPAMPYTIDPSFTNNNPVVPYWSGPGYYGGSGGWGGGYDDYPFWDGDGGTRPCPPSPTPITKSVILMATGIILIGIKNRFPF